MLYVDTSVIVKLYFKEEYSQAVSIWLKSNDEAIPLTSFHELELTNAIHLKQFRTEITPDETRLILSMIRRSFAKILSSIIWRFLFRLGS